MIEYRKAIVDEADILAKIRVDFLCEANNITDDAEIKLLLDNNKHFMFKSLSDGSFTAWVAIDNGTIIATNGISFYSLPPNKKCPNGETAYISNMFTYPKYRKQGIASKLFELGVEEAKNRGCKKVLLNATTMGRPIYEKYGFTDLENEMAYLIK